MSGMVEDLSCSANTRKETNLNFAIDKVKSSGPSYNTHSKKSPKQIQIKSENYFIKFEITKTIINDLNLSKKSSLKNRKLTCSLNFSFYKTQKVQVIPTQHIYCI